MPPHQTGADPNSVDGVGIHPLTYAGHLFRLLLSKHVLFHVAVALSQDSTKAWFVATQRLQCSSFLVMTYFSS